MRDKTKSSHGHNYKKTETGGSETPGNVVCCGHSFPRKFVTYHLTEGDDHFCCHNHEIQPTTNRHTIYAAKVQEPGFLTKLWRIIWPA